MKKTLRKLILAALATNMALVALPVASAWAEASQTSTEESSEVTNEETAADTTADANETGHPLAAVLTAESSENLALLTAFEAYQQVASQFVVQDLAASDIEGSSYQEVKDQFKPAAELEEFELSDTEMYLSYVFEDEEISEATGANRAAELILYFSDDVLTYIGIASLDMDLYVQDVLPEEEIETWIVDQVTIETVAERQTRIMGLSEMVYDGMTYHMLFLPTVSIEEEVYGDFMVIADGAVYDSYPLVIDEASESPQTTMLNLFNNFFGFSGEEDATEESTEETTEEITSEDSAE